MIRRPAEFQQIGEDIANLVPVEFRAHVLMPIMRRHAVVFQVENNVAIANQLRHLLKRLAGEQADMLPVVPLTGINALHSVLELRMPFHRGVQAGRADPVPGAVLQHAQCFGEKANLLLLADMLNKILMKYEIHAVRGNWPSHVGIGKKEYIDAVEAIVVFWNKGVMSRLMKPGAGVQPKPTCMFTGWPVSMRLSTRAENPCNSSAMLAGLRMIVSVPSLRCGPMIDRTAR